MECAGDARNLVGNGKPRLGSRTPAECDHYQHLPAATQIHTDMKPMDYIGLYLIVIIASCVTINWLYRIYL